MEKRMKTIEKAKNEVLGNVVYCIANCFRNIKIFERNYIFIFFST